MTSETTGGGSSGRGGGGGGYAGDSSGGEETGKGLKEWWNKFKAGKGGGGAQAATPATGIASSRAREVPYQSTSTGEHPSSSFLSRRIFSLGSRLWMDRRGGSDGERRGGILPSSLELTFLSFLPPLPLSSFPPQLLPQKVVQSSPCLSVKPSPTRPSPSQHQVQTGPSTSGESSQQWSLDGSFNQPFFPHLSFPPTSPFSPPALLELANSFLDGSLDTVVGT